MTYLVDARKGVIVYDSTLREGEQMPGVSFSSDEKVEIASMLIEAGVHQIEAGFAAISEEEKRSIKRIAAIDCDSDILSLSRVRKSDIDDAISCDVDMVLLFIATSELHMREKLRSTADEVIESIGTSIEYAKERGVSVAFSPEDATRTDPDFLKRVYQVAAEHGADRLGITDTVGCACPETISQIVRLARSVSDLPISVHLHNDFGLALANAISAVKAGANAVATTICGIGERAGNVPLEQFVMSMKYLYNTNLGIRTDLFTPMARRISELTGVEMPPHQPWIGKNAFAHESGIHVAAVLKDPETYEFLPPEIVGNARQIVLGKHSGRSLISLKLKERKLDAPREKLDAILHQVKQQGELNGKVSDEEFWKIVAAILNSNGERHNFDMKSEAESV